MKNGNIQHLRAMLDTAGECAVCTLSDLTLGELLKRYPCYELAAYRACILLSQEGAMRLADGTATPSQSRYWLRRAADFRPNTGRALRRADFPFVERERL